MSEALNQQQRLAVSLALWVADRVALTAARFTRRVQADDLVQVARTALAEAARRFDPSKGASLEAFAWMRIVGAVLRVLGRDSKRQQRALGAFLAMLDVPADAGTPSPDTDEEASSQINERCDDAAMVLFLAFSAEDWQSAGEPGFIRRETAMNARRLVQGALDSVDDVPRRIIHLRYWDERTWPEIVDLMRLSKTTVQYHERRAREQIRRYLLAHGLRGHGEEAP